MLSKSRDVVVAVVAALVVLLGALGAGSSLPPLLEPAYEEASHIPEALGADDDRGEEELDPGTAELPEFEEPAPRELPDWLFEAIAVGVLLILVPALAWFAYRYWKHRKEQLQRQAQLPTNVVEDAPAVREEELADVFDDALARLRHGVDVDAVILGCWRELERLAAGAGVERESWQTPTEFTVELLSQTSVDEPALLELAELYKQAAFSDHQLAEAHREGAIAALERLQTGLVRHG